ncbi:amino acid ABC transporter permease [Bosea sp. (in: a-proteobacteria)]|jgi:polar amino acid transport system permease protein|uniref:amino acid ABC transporter permease n=1 Tax=Bosea sp. (in: a-proteobacteria) TaxID=1871050 RepID=UPI0022BC6E76|nr:amino acid ABC transporter permease [Beijerinckiaceae bacterium]
MRASSTDLPVLLPYRAPPDIAPSGLAAPILLGGATLACFAILFAASLALAQVTARPIGESATTVLLRWAPLIFQGFLFNILISFLSMALGTVVGVLVGIAQVSVVAPVRGTAWGLTQFFRNAPWLVLLFYAMFLLPFEFRVLGLTIAFPAWVKAIIGLALPVAANVSEIVRGGIRSIPSGQWESAESLAFNRRQTMWMIILPQAFKRMIPPWMNLYAILTMATTLISVVGIQDGLTITRAALVAESRPELMIPMYLLLLLMFFAYCYPIARATLSLERRFNVKA